MIHMPLIAPNALACYSAGHQAVSPPMFGEEVVERGVQIEPHRAPEPLAHLLFPAGRSLRDAVRIGEIRAAAVAADDSKALCPLIGHHDLKMVHAAAHLRDILGMRS